jgi:hypothetical protein
MTLKKSLREHNPLEQGLKRFFERAKSRRVCILREHNPLEQGLKPEVFCVPFPSLLVFESIIH